MLLKTELTNNLYFVILVNQLEQILESPRHAPRWNIFDKTLFCYFFILDGRDGRNIYHDRAKPGTRLFKLLSHETEIINISEYILKLCK